MKVPNNVRNSWYGTIELRIASVIQGDCSIFASIWFHIDISILSGGIKSLLLLSPLLPLLLTPLPSGLPPSGGDDEHELHGGCDAQYDMT
jgi:hypothetical protein